MEYTGLVHKYPIDRLLSDEERSLQLHQRKRIDVEPSSQLRLIRLNSTYMEIVDKYFSDKGTITMGVGCVALIVSIAYIAGVLFSLTHEGRISNDWPVLLAAGAMVLIAEILFFWMISFECFRCTHYPIRFNRKTRMVHVFRINGTVLSIPWDKVFFCIGRVYRANSWEVQGHVLAEDGKTVLETFSLSECGTGLRDREVLKHLWEYVRRYMEDGPSKLSDRMKAVLPIADERESFLFGWHRTMSASYMLLPIYVFIYPGRWIAMHTSKIPKWPEEIERVCQVEPGDPYIRDASMNPA